MLSFAHSLSLWLQGDSYEICLTTELQRGQAPNALHLYRTLRSVNPAPYAAWLHLGPEGPQVSCCCIRVGHHLGPCPDSVPGCRLTVGIGNHPSLRLPCLPTQAYCSACAESCLPRHLLACRSRGPPPLFAAPALLPPSRTLPPTAPPTHVPPTAVPACLACQCQCPPPGLLLLPRALALHGLKASHPLLPALSTLQVCCSSPERFLRGDRGGLLEARPIKGTAPRQTGDPAADAAAAAALAASEKDRAENLMIVDLLRWAARSEMEPCASSEHIAHCDLLGWADMETCAS